MTLLQQTLTKCKMKYYLTFIFMIASASLFGQNKSTPIPIKWIDNLTGDFSFSNLWDFPNGVEVKQDGRAGCSDDGFCPERCYAMLDSNGIVLEDSVKIFYQLLDTTHQVHSIQCDAWCYEWDGTDFIDVLRKTKDSVQCSTACGILTHCSLLLGITNNICFATIELNSIVDKGSATYYCTDGSISIDKNLWQDGIMKAEFNFNFKNNENPKKPIYWKGKIYAKIKTI